jgi:hypothetical protein
MVTTAHSRSFFAVAMSGILDESFGNSSSSTLQFLTTIARASLVSNGPSTHENRDVISRLVVFDSVIFRKNSKSKFLTNDYVNMHNVHRSTIYTSYSTSGGLFLSKIVVRLVKSEMSWIPSKAMDIIDMTVSIRVVLGM